MKDYTKKILKKRLYGYGGVLLALLLLLALASPIRNAGMNADSTQDTTSSAGGTRPYRGSVTVYTCDSSLYSSFCILAEAYTGQTGIPVTVLTGTHEDLGAAMSGTQVPSLFCLHSQADMEQWESTLYDLSDAALLDKLWSPDFALTLGGKPLALTADLEGYGLIYNATLLAQVGFTRSDIQDFADLEMVAQFISGKDLDYAAFSAMDLSDTTHAGMTCLLAGMLRTPEALRSFWDLYLANDAKSGKSLEKFLQGDAVFYVGSTQDYEKVSDLGVNNLDILPAYSPAGNGLQCVSTLAWGLNQQANDQDLQQTLAFLDWLVTAAEGSSAPIDQLGLLSPFRDAAAYSNPLEKKLRSYIATEPVAVGWDCCGWLTDTQLAALSEALAAYSADATDEKWQAVADLLAPAV